MKEPGQINMEDVFDKLEEIDRRLNDFDAYFRLLMHQKRSDKSDMLIDKLKKEGKMTISEIRNYFGGMQAGQVINMVKRIEKTKFRFKYIKGQQGKEPGIVIYQTKLVMEKMNETLLGLLEKNDNKMSVTRIMTKLDLFDYKEANKLIDAFIKKYPSYIRIQDRVIINDPNKIMLLEYRLMKDDRML